MLQTSRPGVFAAGDVRSGSVERVASAVGEGAMVAQFVHEVLEEVQGPEDPQIQGRRSCPPRSDGAPERQGYPGLGTMGRNFLTARIPSTMKVATVASCATRNGGSDCVGASRFRAGTFRKAWTTRTKTFR